MNILYTNFHYTHGGGHTTYILALLKNSRHTCYVACPESSRLYAALEEQNYPRLLGITFPSKLGQIRQTVKNTKRLSRFIEEHDIDIVHTNGSRDNQMALFASFICKKKFKVAYTKHNTIPVKGFFSKMRLNRFNDAVIIVAQSVIAAAGLTPTPRYHIVENGIDIDYWRRKSGFAAGSRITLASNAGTGKNKGWIHLFEGLALLSEEEQKRFGVVLMGRDDPFLMERIDGLKSRFDFRFAGYLDDPRPELEAADVGFILSYREACSFSAREMMSMGLPVLTSDFAGSDRDVTPETGWMTRMKDAESVRDALRAILALKPEELAAMKAATRRRAEELFSIEKMIDETNKVYAGMFADKS